MKQFETDGTNLNLFFSKKLNTPSRTSPMSFRRSGTRVFTERLALAAAMPEIGSTPELTPPSFSRRSGRAIAAPAGTPAVTDIVEKLRSTTPCVSDHAGDVLNA